MSSILSIALLVLPILAIALLITKRKNKCGAWLTSTVVTAIIFYLTMMIMVKVVRLESERSVKKYDLDGDGSYSQEEFTPEAEKALDDWASDTGLNLAPITGLFVAPIYSSFWHVIVGVPYLLLINRKNRSNGEQVGSSNGG